MADFVVTCPQTGQPCVVGCVPRVECVEREVARILAMSDEQINAEHLRMYGGDQLLADKAVDMMVAGVQAAIGRVLPQ